MLQSLDGVAIRHWAATCCDALAAHRDEIDALNVFPVADFDTGSNLLATMRAGLDAVLRDHGDDRSPPSSTVAVLARGALMGARGNSGVILSQILRGLAEAPVGAALDGAALREGLRRAGELATAAVSNPVSGTVLTVLHDAAQAAMGVPSDDLGDVAAAATIAAAGALAETPRQLDVLAAAGVVDAGGRGLVVLLEALLTVVTECRGMGLTVTAEIPARPASTRQAPHEVGSSAYEYEVMYLLDGTDEARAGTLRAELAVLGDCVAVVSSGPGAAALWKVHVHCCDVGAAIEAGIRAGRPHRITVLRLTDRSCADQPGADQSDVVQPGADQSGATTAQGRFITGHAVLAMVSGSGLAELFRSEGAFTASSTSSATELLAVLAGTRARHITVLASPAAASRIAEITVAHARDTGQVVVVVPTASAVQALAAIAVHDAGRPAAEDLMAMTEAAAGTRRGELAVASAAAPTWVGCQPGDVLGTVGDEVVLTDCDSLAAARGLAEVMLSEGGELVTVLLGQHAPDGVGDMLIKHLRAVHPEVETVVYAADVPDSMLLIGVE
ncbi:MAG TPA: DAK2 domain-containing protein [Pseudonocardiaceae bacterium]|nr:DAK2 domain-containing protein [Pseudonocardiaceae bacterium]